MPDENVVYQEDKTWFLKNRIVTTVSDYRRVATTTERIDYESNITSAVVQRIGEIILGRDDVIQQMNHTNVPLIAGIEG